MHDLGWQPIMCKTTHATAKSAPIRLAIQYRYIQATICLYLLPLILRVPSTLYALYINCAGAFINFHRAIVGFWSGCCTLWIPIPDTEIVAWVWIFEVSIPTLPTRLGQGWYKAILPDIRVFVWVGHKYLVGPDININTLDSYNKPKGILEIVIF